MKKFNLTTDNYGAILVLILLFISINSFAQTSSFDHSIFDRLLKKHVSQSGQVDYQSFTQDRTLLRQYLRSLGNVSPDTISWSKEEQLAYWINLYNAFTTELILNHYPLESIKDIGTKIPLVFGDSAWDIEFVNVNNTTYTLDDIEHKILRAKFDEPRIHFALVCAAASCPNLRREAYSAEKLESQLNSQAVIFLSNPVKNKIGANAVRISEIFKWYSEEFTKTGSLIDYLNQFTTLSIDQNASVDYYKFDWKLNGLK